MNLNKLKAPFAPNDLELRPGNKSGNKAMALFYVTARAIMDRLDEAVGPANWYAEYAPAVNDPKGQSVQATIYIQVEPGVWVGKSDAADNSNVESTKGGYSNALKRAGVHWGIGRYLYEFPTVFLPLQGNNFGVTAQEYIDSNISKYAEFLPDDYQPQSVPKRTPKPENTTGSNSYTAKQRKDMQVLFTNIKEQGDADKTSKAKEILRSGDSFKTIKEALNDL